MNSRELIENFIADAEAIMADANAKIGTAAEELQKLLRTTEDMDEEVADAIKALEDFLKGR